MALTNSTFTLQAGAAAPEFTLPDGSGTSHSLGSLAAEKKTTVIVFACNHCPFVVHLAKAFGEFASEYADKGVQTIAINSNDVANYPADSPEKMVEFARENGWDFPYLYDADQSVAKAYAAACTPDFYVFDADLKLGYAGQFDATRPNSGGEIDAADLRAAVDTALAGTEVAQPWKPSAGCNIKWQAGNEPAYFG